EKLPEMEIKRLQKQFRIAVEKRRCYAANVKQQMQAQENGVLAQEHKGALLMLNQNTSQRNAMLDDRVCMELRHLLQRKHQYDYLIRDRKALLADLDNQVRAAGKKIVRQNQVTAKAEQARNSKQVQQKQIETLEMCLSTVTVQFGTILTRNSELREEIENLQIHKGILDNIFLKLHKKVNQQRRRMNNAVQQSTEAFRKRMDALARISAINKIDNVDTVQYNAELQKRDFVIDQETKLKTFMLAKCTDRFELEEEAIKKRALKAVEQARQNQGETFASREVAYRQLMELAEDGDVDQLLDRFIEKERKNFFCFLSAIELSNEFWRMKQRIKGLKNEIKTIVMEREHVESSTLHVLKELEEKLKKTTEEANWYEDRCKESSKVLGQFKSSVEVLSKEISCGTMTIVKQLGENRQMTDLNLMQLLDLVDKRTNELLLMEAVLRYTSAQDSQPGQPSVSP
ncbi:Coiled-coil domain-containing protein 63, partial [Cariama cristata]